MIEFFVHLVVTAALLLLVANLVRGISVESWGSAIIAARAPTSRSGANGASACGHRPSSIQSHRWCAVAGASRMPFRWCPTARYSPSTAVGPISGR